MFESGMPTDGKSTILVLETELHDRNDVPVTPLEISAMRQYLLSQ